MCRHLGLASSPRAKQDATRLGVDGIPDPAYASQTPRRGAGLRGVDMRTSTLGDVIVSVNDKPVAPPFRFDK